MPDRPVRAACRRLHQDGARERRARRRPMHAGQPTLIAKARAGDDDAFGALTEPHRRELQVHCYRMLGSLQDAEDALQDTLLAAWHGLAGFEERASLRTWLYRIATNRCLDALRAARRRPAKAWDVPGVEPPEPTGARRGRVARALPRRLLDGRRGRPARPRGPLRPDRVHLPRLRHRTPAPPAPPARRPGAARRARVPRRARSPRCSARPSSR